jgi:nickel/cobalt transporter (NicO) family protein
LKRRLPMVAIGSVIAGLTIMAGPAPPAMAHPLGNFTVNLYSGISVAPGRLEVDYVLDFAEVPTFREKRVIDTDGDGSISTTERSAWAHRTASDLGAGISLSVSGRSTTLELVSDSMRLLPGQGGLQVLRLEATFAAPVPPSGRLEYRDGNFPDRPGWREIVAVGLEGRAVRESSVPTTSVSNALRSYPEDLLSNPLDVTEASLWFGPGSQRSSALGTTADGVRPGGGVFAGLVSRPTLSLTVVLASLMLAFGLGAMHALAPGHGKTLLAAYLVGTGGGVRHAVALGVAVSAMHTFSVLGIGLAILWIERAFAPEDVYPWLGLIAGVVGMTLGTSLLIARLRAPTSSARHEHAHLIDGTVSPLSRRGLAAIAVSGGILPSPAALVVLLGAVALQRVVFGLSLIAAFSLGLAAALVAVGLVSLRATDLIAARLHDGLARRLPVVSAAAIAVVGVVLAIRGLAQF